MRLIVVPPCIATTALRICPQGDPVVQNILPVSGSPPPLVLLISAGDVELFCLSLYFFVQQTPLWTFNVDVNCTITSSIHFNVCAPTFRITFILFSCRHLLLDYRPDSLLLTLDTKQLFLQ